MLKYLFEAHFKDGTIITQNKEDQSTIDPTRSSFYDVAQKLDDVVLFGIFNKHNTYVVDLRDGHFEVNGVAFSAQPVTSPVMNEGGKFSLVYFRDNEQSITFDRDNKVVSKAHHIQYRLGWTYKDPNGKEYNQTIVVV